MIPFHLTNYAFNPNVIPPLIALVALGALGIGVVWRERASYPSRLFCLVTLTVSVWLFAFAWMYCAVDPATALWWAKCAYLGVPLIPAAMYHLTIVVLGRSAQHGKTLIAVWIVAALFVVTILDTDWLIVGVQRYWWGYYPRYGWLGVLYLPFFFVVILASFRHYLSAYRHAIPGTPASHRIRGLLIAFSVVYLGSVDYVAKYGIGVYPFGYLAVLAFVILAARAIWRYRLIEITPAVAAPQILNTIADALLVIDRESTIRLANAAVGTLFRIDERALIGQPVATALRGTGMVEHLVEHLNEEARAQDQELSLTVGSDEGRVVSLSTSILRDSAHQPIATIYLLHDMTERKRAEEASRRAHVALQHSHDELREAHLQLIQAAKMESVGRLAAGVAHEVKNPLAIILQGVDYLAKRLNGDEQTTLVLRYTGDAVRRADAVIRGLLDFSTARELEQTSVSLDTVIEQALLLLKHELDRCHMTLVRLYADSLPLLPLDRNKMEQVFVNVFMNAIQAMPQGGTLTVTTRVARLDDMSQGVGRRKSDRFAVGERVVVAEVDDTGPGIAQEMLDKLFDPFFTTKPTGQGTGLGLTVTKSIIELHGGFIRISNRPGGGARVTIALAIHGGTNGHQANPDRG